MRLVEPAAFTKLSALGVEEQRVNIIIDIVEPKEERETLGDGYRVEARIVTWNSDEAIKVPTAALFRVDEDWAVFTVDAGNKARLQRIRAGKKKRSRRRSARRARNGHFGHSAPQRQDRRRNVGGGSIARDVPKASGWSAAAIVKEYTK